MVYKKLKGLEEVSDSVGARMRIQKGKTAGRTQHPDVLEAHLMHIFRCLLRAVL